MSDLKVKPSEMRATIQITRKATGKVDTYEIVGSSDPDQLKVISAKVYEIEGDVVAAVTTKEKE